MSFFWGYLLCGLSILKAREHVAGRGVEENKQKAGKESVLSDGHPLSWEIDSGIIDSAVGIEVLLGHGFIEAPICRFHWLKETALFSDHWVSLSLLDNSAVGIPTASSL